MTEQCKARMPWCECCKVKQESAFIYKKAFFYQAVDAMYLERGTSEYPELCIVCASLFEER